MEQLIERDGPTSGWTSGSSSHARIAQHQRLSWPLGLILLLSAGVSLLVLGWVLWYCRYGIDFADEGFYLVWISNPFKYSVSASQFGYFYHPLYLLLNGSVVALRIVNAILTFALAWWVAALSLAEVFGKKALPRPALIVIAAAFGTTSLMFLRLWLPTPSYNWLAFQGMSVIAAGMLLAERDRNPRSQFGWMLIGVGGWMAFMAKPTTAAALGLLVLIYLAWARKLRASRLALALSVSIVLCAITAFAIDGSLMLFVDRLRAASEQARLLGAGHTFSKVFRLDDFRFDYPARQALAWAVMFVGGAAFLLSARNMLARLLALVLALSALAAIAVIVLGIPEKPTEYGEFQHLVLLAVPLAILVLAVLLSGRELAAEIPRRHWALGFVWLAFPHAFAFGTSNNYWWFGGLVGFFWVMAALVLLGPAAARRSAAGLLLPIALGAQLIAVTQVHSGIEGPYYQPQPLHADDFRVDFGRQGSKVFLPRTYGNYVTAALDIAARAGFTPGTPMIDLSGHSPGLLYAIGAMNTAQPWIIGNYPGYSGSEAVAKQVIGAASCDELGRAWLLVEPGGPVSLPVSLLSLLGANLTQDYELMGEFETAPIVGGFTPVKTQQIYKPLRSAADAARMCGAVREGDAGTLQGSTP
ncbi:hypothetical protein [Cupriavidus metallidurans]|uniref:hypothetical protein n=1 Tax=Cupriavidus metallidurans TaxID=119219 RepID=UPI0016468FED|nr:hypothetical protein [Cupriavidus metallidurans]